MENQKIYFPNLNGLRFIAAFLVIIHHIEQIKIFFNLESFFEKIPFVYVIGKLGVVLFFVLSGFLITYLLLVEEKVQKNINIRKFYIRRILRIWPLYYLIIILAFFVFPYIKVFLIPGYEKEIVFTNFNIKLLLYAIFFPNLVTGVVGLVPYASHTWSIGTEEQFYLVWPILMKYFKKFRILLMLFIIVFYLSFKGFLLTDYSQIIPYKFIIIEFWRSFNIDCMAIGGIFAILLFQKNKIIAFLNNNLVFYISLFLALFLIINGISFKNFQYEIYAVLFGIIILNFATNDKIKINLENRFFNYLGNISYGIYMYHPIAIVLSIKLCLSIDLTSNWLIYPLSFILSVIIAGLSYKYFESFFLKFKDKFSVILSGNKK